ncbi:CD109 antigen isoform X3 [Cryptotermes secundus]|uniref:CD109 antigen isoform X3 n=1 Tax=Cryptotermes secundus TaxID=105785 RepID=UPI000CD7AF3E|nr:CD109 antigen isoform X3 [Cryptotermes secundus]
MVIPRLVLLGVLCVVEGAVQTGFYTIVAPRVLRPNSEYHVAITTQKTSQPTTVTVGVGGNQHGGGTFQASQTVTVSPYTTHIVKLEIGDLGPGTYNLTARGINGLEFINTTTLHYVHKSHSVFIQTDKAVYKPGHKVQFRALILNAHLKPSVTGALDVYITDGKGNRVKQWSRALTTKGVFSGEFQLSQSPVLGDWNITVVVMDQYFYKTFQVAEYVLPKFEVTIDAPAHATFKDSHLVATVYAKYTYGKAVKGEATVTVYPTYYSGLLQPIFQNPVRKVVPIDGKANVEFDITKDLQLGEEYERSVQIDVTVEEALTGRRQNTTFEVMLHKYKYKMELIKTSEYFKPGLKYTAFVKLTYHDGTPVQDMNNPVTVRYGYTFDHNAYTEEKHKLSKDGMVTLNFYPPLENQTVLWMEAEYLDLKEWFSTVSASVSPSNTFLQAVVKTEHPTVNQDVELEVNSTEPMKYFTYQVIGRGDVIMANTIKLADKKTHNFRFLATYVMAPVAHVMVYYVKEDGEVVANALDIELEGALQNFVNITTNSEETQPGTDVELTVEAKPNSYVGILGVDQSVLLLKSGSDITKDAVLEELRLYDSNLQTPYHYGFNFRGNALNYWWPGSATAREVFDSSGAVILTNGLVHEHFPWVYYRSVHVMEEAAVPNMPPAIEETAAFGSVAGATGSTEPAIRVRRNFPETWLWHMLEAGFDGKATIRKFAPDTITSWVISGFSVDPLFGLGLSEAPRKLRVFRPFFVSLDLPYSVIRDEIVAIPIVVFNYMNKDVEADVTLENEQLDNFEFAEVSNDVNEQPKLELYRRKRVSVRANSGSSVSFMITPKKLGHITIKVTASSPLAGDSVVKKLLVKPEGETQYYNKAIFVDLRNKQPFQTTVTLDVPKNIVAGSDMVEVSAVGDILGPSIPNLANLIRMPSGCGEQNMLNFVPNIVIVEYLKNTNQLTAAVEGTALGYMERGYQQELTYRHSDGSFSAFGSKDDSGSTWLTAFVVKSFQQAMPYVNIEDSIIQEALRWLSMNQAANGSFSEVGKVIHQDMQGGAAKGLALTAYTMIAFLENQQSSAQLYRNTINKALDYIVRNLEGLDDIYALAVSNYALHLAQHAAKDKVFNLFESKAQSSGDLKWWRKPIGVDDQKNPWYGLPNSVDVEMTAYGLLTYLQRGLVQDALPVMKWLITQRNEQGGFASTQDTVIGLQALAKLAERVSSMSVDISVSFLYPGGSPTYFKINRANSMIVQKHELPGKVRKIDISASGSGFAVVQVSYRYNLNVTGAWPLFTLDPQVDKNSDRNHLQLSICSGFIGAQGVNESNMAVMEVTLPSGFTVDSDALPSLRMSQNVKRVETKNGDTVIMLYFDKMTRQEYCPTVSAFRTHKVAKQKPVPVTIYDYYDSSRRARVFYEPRVATLCDICEGEDCSTSCSSKPYSHSHENNPSTATRVLLSSMCVVLSVVFLQGWVS